MSYRPIYIVDIFADIVTRTSAQLLADGTIATGVNYLYGHPLEILDSLQKLTKIASSQGNRYPLVALFQDFDEVRGKDDTIEFTVSLNLIIASLTKPEYKAADRYKYNFKPILYPIYEELITQIKVSRYFKDPMTQYSHKKTDRMYWGRNGLFGKDGSVYNDFIDAIEIQDLELKVKPLNCFINVNYTEHPAL